MDLVTPGRRQGFEKKHNADTTNVARAPTLARQAGTSTIDGLSDGAPWGTPEG